MKHSKLVALSLFLAMLLITGCKNNILGTATVKGNGITIGDQLNISIETNENIQIFNSDTDNSARTLLTDAFKLKYTGKDENNNDKEYGDTLYFYLYGTSQSGQTLNPKLVDVSSTDGITGKVTIDIESYNWELTLVATEEKVTFEETDTYDTEVTAVKNAGVLIAYANVDMMFTNSIKFTLVPDGLTKPGQVDLKLIRENVTTDATKTPYLAWTIPEGYVATAGIYDITTGKAILGKAKDATSYADSLTETIADYSGETATDNFNGLEFDAEKKPKATGDSAYTANDKYIAPGTYSFRIDFKKDGENRTYNWNQKILILPGKTTSLILDESADDAEDDKSSLIYVPNLIGTIPTAPKDFVATILTDTSDKTPNFYNVAFTWDGSEVNTEVNFAMDIKEIDDSQDALTSSIAAIEKAEDRDTAWDDVTAAKTYTFDYLNDVRSYSTEDQTVYYTESSDSDNKKSSLLANSERLELQLKLGKRYIARLYSENNAGKSETAAYVTITDGATENTYYEINRFRVTYHLQGGTWNNGTESSNDQIEYWGKHYIEDPDDADSYIVEPYTVIAPKGETDEETGTVKGTEDAPWLYSGAANWLYWTKGLGGDKWVYAEDDEDNYDADDPYAPKTYSDSDNLDLYAAYVREGEIEIYDDSDYEILSSYVSGFEKEAGNIKKNTTNTFSKGSNTEGKVSLTVPSTSTWKYDKVILTITYGGRTYVAQEQTGNAAGTANTFTFNLSSIPTGYVYNCEITAHYKKTIVDYPFAMLITD